MTLNKVGMIIIYFICTGSIPDSLSQLLALQTINLNENSLSGRVPSSIGNLTSLTELLLRANDLTGPMPDLSRLGSLRYLWLQTNSLTGLLDNYLLIFT